MTLKDTGGEASCAKGRDPNRGVAGLDSGDNAASLASEDNRALAAPRLFVSFANYLDCGSLHRSVGFTMHRDSHGPR